MPAQPPAHAPTAALETADALSHEAFAQAQDPLDIAAATWATRRRSGLDAQGQAELNAWLDADPKHPAALADMDATFESVRNLPRTVGQRPAQSQAKPAAKRSTWSLGLAPTRLGRPAAAMAFAGALACVSWISWSHWQAQPTFEQAYATARGQQLGISLPDGSPRGSVLHLDTDTRLDARLFRDHREVQLKDGQALFSVQSDASRPFHVLAGAVRITVVGTRFSVRHTVSGLDAGRTVVSVEEGRVKVQSPAQRPDADATGAMIELTAGQEVVADASGHLGAVHAVPPDAIAAWRDGRVSFDQTPLAQAVAEFERYGSTGLVIRDPAVAAMRVGGSHDVRQFQRFVDSLPQVLPVQLVRQGRETEVKARQPQAD